MKRPAIGVTVFGTLFLFNGVNNLLLALTKPSGSRADAVIALLIAIACLTSGIGLFMVQQWARWLALILASASLVWVVAEFLKQPSPPTTFLVYLIFGLAFDVLLIWYFLRPSVKAQFVKTATSDK